MATPYIIQQILRCKHESPALFAWEIRDQLVAQRICDEESIPSVSSINRILRNAADYGAADASVKSHENTAPSPGTQSWGPGYHPYVYASYSYSHLSLWNAHVQSQLKARQAAAATAATGTETENNYAASRASPPMMTSSVNVTSSNGIPGGENSRSVGNCSEVPPANDGNPTEMHSGRLLHTAEDDGNDKPEVVRNADCDDKPFTVFTIDSILDQTDTTIEKQPSTSATDDAEK